MDRGLVDITCCTALMINMLENFQSTLPEDFYGILWDYFIRNLSFNSGQLKVINSQLLGMLLWTAPSQILHLAHSQNKLDIVFRQITAHERRYEHDYQRARVILGVNSLLLFANESAELRAAAPTLFKTILNLITKNADKRLQEEKANIDDDDISSNPQMPEWSISWNSEDCFYEPYNENYDSCLNNIDEIAEFRKTIEQLRVENSIIYE